MIDLTKLSENVGAIVTLDFSDNHAVKAEVITVDRDEPLIVYKVIEIITRGPDSLSELRPGVVAAADPSTLRNFSVG